MNTNNQNENGNLKSKLLLAAAAVFFVVSLAAAGKIYEYLRTNYEQPLEQKLEQEENGQKETDGNETDAKSEGDESVVAENFTVLDEKDNEVTLFSKLGKPVVVNFWASWCSPCKAEMPDFETFYKEYGDTVEFMMINMTDGSRETKEGAMEFIASEGYTFPLYFDTEQNAAAVYGVYSIPTTLFINAEGEIVATGKGMLSKTEIREGLQKIMP